MTVSTPTGHVVRDADGVRLVFVRSFDQPPAVVWDGLTGHDAVARWMGRWSGDPASGVIELEMAAEEGAPSSKVDVKECRAPEALTLEMPSPDGVWQLSVRLAPRGDGTELTFVQPLDEPYDASSIGPGWHYYLDRLTSVITGTELSQEFDDYYPSTSAAYAIPASVPDETGSTL